MHKLLENTGARASALTGSPGGSTPSVVMQEIISVILLLERRCACDSESGGRHRSLDKAQGEDTQEQFRLFGQWVAP